jgi:hypothetical protein
MKTKQEKIINGLFIGALVLVIIIFIANKNKSFAAGLPSLPGTNPNPAPSPSSGGSGGSWSAPAPSPSAPINVSEMTILRRGDRNEQVRTLQQLYNDRIATPENRTRLVVDGIFGQNTENAIKYVTENTQNTITLQIWRVVTALNKSQRVAYFN